MKCSKVLLKFFFYHQHKWLKVINVTLAATEDKKPFLYYTNKTLLHLHLLLFLERSIETCTHSPNHFSFCHGLAVTVFGCLLLPSVCLCPWVWLLQWTDTPACHHFINSWYINPVPSPLRPRLFHMVNVPMLSSSFLDISVFLVLLQFWVPLLQCFSLFDLSFMSCFVLPCVQNRQHLSTTFSVTY